MGEKILLVGFSCVDICLLNKNYPQEDSCNRLSDVLYRRGGNCSNSCTALRELGVNCHLLTSFGNDDNAEWVKNDLAKIGVTLTHCPQVAYKVPVTYLILSDETGSRTTFLWKNYWPEPTLEDFVKLDLSEYSWVHFEGRNFEETKKMVKYVREWNESRDEDKKLPISVEIEQERQEMMDLLPLGDIVIISKDFALYYGCNNMQETIDKLKGYTRRDATIVVPWGELGATAYLPDGTLFRSPAYPPPKVLDSVAAGDTFIAALILSLSRKHDVEDAVTFACRVAGAKVGIVGFKATYKKPAESIRSRCVRSLQRHGPITQKNNVEVTPQTYSEFTPRI